MSEKFILNGTSFEYPNKTQDLFRFFSNKKIDIPSSCLGKGRCRECMLVVRAGEENLSPKTSKEQHLGEGFRLACQTHVTGPGEIQAQTIKRGQIRVASSQKNITEQVLSDQPVVYQKGTAIFNELGFIEDGEDCFGVAIDLGTTTVVARLFNLLDKTQLNEIGFENPQGFGGSDVLARIKYDSDFKEGYLQKILISYLNKVLKKLCPKTDSIYEIVIAGNATMRDLFFGLDVSPIGVMPYRSTTETDYLEGNRTDTSISMQGKELNLAMNPNGRVYGLPLIASHVGADTAACLLAIDLQDRSKTTMLLDIGTNTEIILAHQGALLAASCPAGPAFEGGGITWGMPGLVGAIERVSIDSQNHIHLQTIEDQPACGICGSGLIDLVSEMLRTDKISSLGRLEDDEEDPFFIDSIKKLFVSEEDLSQLAQAKAANTCGQKIICDAAHISFDSIDQLYLAGGFAQHLSIDAAKNIGLIPALGINKIKQIGNAAIEGASIALLSLDKRMELLELVKTIEHVSLEQSPNFFDYFAEGVQFKPNIHEYHV